VRLGLGTAQFGLDYGVSNRFGRTPPAEVRNILSLAAERGLALIDTAPGYGNSESVLGECLPLNHGFLISTKIKPMRTDAITSEHLEAVKKMFSESLARLRQDHVHAVLIHHVGDLLVDGGDALMQLLEGFRERGLVDRIGVSIYEAREADELAGRYQPGVLQVPVSVADQRLIQGGDIGRWARCGTEIHARSVFLQGFLLMTPDELPPALRHHAPLLERFRNFARENDCLPAHIALKFIDSQKDIASAIVGVNTAAQLEQLLAFEECRIDCSDLRQFAQQDVQLLNPFLWRQ
jgi:aryl-alcohol dehydrogenase-like predicted oxidoreductase